MITGPLSFVIRMGLSTAWRMPEPEIRHTTGAQPTRMIRFYVRTRESPTDRPLYRLKKFPTTVTTHECLGLKGNHPTSHRYALHY
jgi:hypothetical protein